MKSKSALYLACVSLALSLAACASSPAKMSNFSHQDERFVPAGTSVPVNLEQGVTVRNRDDGNPAPLLFTLTDASKFLRGAEYEGATCHVLGNAMGDVVTKRMNVQVERISCNGSDGTPIVTAAAQGYIYGSDKALGLPVLIEDSGGRPTLTVRGDQPATLVISADFGFRFGK